MSIRYIPRRNHSSYVAPPTLQWTRSSSDQGPSAKTIQNPGVDLNIQTLSSSAPAWFDPQFYFSSYPEARLECNQKLNPDQLYDFYLRVGRAQGHFPSEHSKLAFEKIKVNTPAKPDAQASAFVMEEVPTKKIIFSPQSSSDDPFSDKIEPAEPTTETNILDLSGLVLNMVESEPAKGEQSSKKISFNIPSEVVVPEESSTELTRSSSGMNNLKLKRQTSAVFKPVVPNLLNLEQRAKRMNFDLKSVNPEISILLVTYNRIDCTIACLESLHAIKDEMPFEILLWDNHSTDQTLTILNYIPGIQITKSDENLHFLRAVNGLAPKIRAPLTLLFNNDAQIVPGSLLAAKDTLNRIPKCAIVGGKIILRSNGRLQEAGSYFLNGGDPQGYGRNDNPKAPEYNFERPVPYCSGCFLVIKTQVFKELGYLDTRYVPAYFEETDLCVRALKAGYLVYYQPECMIVHEEGASASKEYEPTALMMKNSKIFKDTHGDFLRKLPNNTLEARTYGVLGKRNRILWCESELPDPLKGSGYPRMAQILVWLINQGWEVTYHSIWGDRSLVSELPYGVEFILKSEMTLQQLLAKRSNYYGVAIISRTPTLQAYRTIINQGYLNGIPVVYDMETLAGLREYEKAKYYPSTSDIAAKKMLDDDLALCRLSKGVVVVSEPERQYINSNGCSNVYKLGHILSVPEKLVSAPFEHRFGFVFVGFLDWAGSPNIDSINWFVEKVWPLILNAIPNASFGIIGQILPELQESLALVPGVRVYGAVNSNKINELINYYRAFVAPTRFASGIPHKCHTAASVGIPIVCTQLLAKQLDWNSDIVSSAPCSAAEFAQACIDLHKNELVWKKLQINAFEAVKRDCSFEQMFDFANWLLQLN